MVSSHSIYVIYATKVGAVAGGEGIIAPGSPVFNSAKTGSGHGHAEIIVLFTS